MAKDAKGHGSDAKGAESNPFPASYRQHALWNRAHGISPAAPVAHQTGVNMVGGQRQITIFHQDGEYAVPIPGNKGHSFTNDKADAEATARQMHGSDITIKHRSKRWGPEMD